MSSRFFSFELSKFEFNQIKFKSFWHLTICDSHLTLQSFSNYLLPCSLSMAFKNNMNTGNPNVAYPLTRNIQILGLTIRCYKSKKHPKNLQCKKIGLKCSKWMTHSDHSNTGLVQYSDHHCTPYL